MDPPPPTSTHRLFAHYGDLGLMTDKAAAFVIARLMEEGDTRDLRWLTARYAEAEVAAWLEERGARQLSRRSRSFWQIVLHRPGPELAPIGGDLWPL